MGRGRAGAKGAEAGQGLTGASAWSGRGRGGRCAQGARTMCLGERIGGALEVQRASYDSGLHSPW
eukprot:14709130-Heterocapsa_arctica.AAC.1